MAIGQVSVQGTGNPQARALRAPRWASLIHDALATPRGRAGAVLVMIVVLIAAVGPAVAPDAPTAFATAPFARPSARNLLGGDVLGRDVLSRLLDGGWQLLAMAAIATALGVAAGTAIGIVAAFRGRLSDTLLMRAVDVLLAFPQLVFALLLVSIAGPNVWLIVTAVAISHAPQVARVIRSAALDVCERDFVKSAELIAISPRRVMAGEVLPSLTSPLMVETGLRLTYSIIVISGLSFLGFGIQPPAPNWGTMINENRIGLASNPWAVIIPAVLLAVLTVGMNTLTDSLARVALGVQSAQPATAAGPIIARVGRTITEATASTDEAAAGAAPLRLVVQGLRVAIGGSRAEVVDDVSFALHAGQTLGLVGESGSGKTTVALALMGYARRGLTIDRGQVLVDGEDLLSMSRERMRTLRGSRVAYVPQDPSSALNPALTIGTQLREVLNKQASRERADLSGQRRLTEVLGEVRLDKAGVLDAYPHELSGGQQQRVTLAMAFALRPAVIVLDEPTTGLDVTTQRHVLDTIRDLCASHSVAGIFVSHDLAVVAELVDHVAVMYAGRLVEVGPKPAVLGTPTHPYTRALLRAVPSPDRSRTLVGLDGRPPQPGAHPQGCSFAPRCAFVQERCTACPPPMVAVAVGSHAVRCVRANELAASGTQDGSVNGLAARSAGAATLLSVSHLSASYGNVPVLDEVTLALNPGECLAIVGESGSGKTTLARCMIGLHHRWSGEVTLDARPLARSVRARPAEALRAVQYIFQNPYGSLNPRKRVQQILEQPLTRFFSLSARARLERIIAALEDVSLDGNFLHRTPGELSGGERQRVAIARALVVEPEILVCDEITSALDVSVQAAIVELLRRLQDERGLALVFITHNLALVRSIAQRVLVMRDGRVIEAGDTETLLGHPQTEYTRQLLSDIPRPFTPPGTASTSRSRIAGEMNTLAARWGSGS
jgi:peptide/nickel transport system ATP-binding protein